MIVYGMAFDFFNISGSLFVEQEANSSIRASAQGLFFMMTNGLGAIIGGYASGAVVDAFSVYADGRLVSREWDGYMADIRSIRAGDRHPVCFSIQVQTPAGE